MKKKRPKPKRRKTMTAASQPPKPQPSKPQSLTPKMNSINEHLVEVWSNRHMSPDDRAQMAIYHIVEHGLDFVPALTQIIVQNDEAQKLESTLKMLGEEALATERYLGPAKINGVGDLASVISGVKYAWVTSKDSVTCLPCDVKDELKTGDLVLIAPKVQRIVAKDGDLASTGCVSVVAAIPEGSTGQVVVKNGELQTVAWLHHSLLEKTLLDKPVAVGDKVVYDERHRFVLSRVNTDTDGKELLAELANLPTVHRHQVGSPHPIADQIISHFQDAIERPEWLEQLGSRDRRGYLFIGQTGGGKSYHIKMIATEVHDLVEQHTGKRTSRVFLCDASNFWSPYFGETEQRINDWAKKIARLGNQKLVDKRGHELKVPILGVIEECEALFRSRGGDQHASGHLFDRVLALLLQKLESVEDALGVPIVWVCSTNRPDLIDAAAMRRIGMRKAIFGNLSAEATRLVMLTKTADLKDSEAVSARVTDFLHKQQAVLATVLFSNQTSRPLCRSDLVTPAILEEAVSHAVDVCLTNSREARKLQKVSAEHMTEFLESHYKNLARMLTSDNLPEHCPEWFADSSLRVSSVKVAR